MRYIISTITRLITTPAILTPSLVSSTAATTSQNLGTCAFVASAERSSAAINGSALGAARPASVLTTRELSESAEPAEPAYNLTVEVDECYFVLGRDGRAYLVSNSSHGATAFYTGAMSYEGGAQNARPKRKERYSGGPGAQPSHWAS
jgi:hypothetical protein